MSDYTIISAKYANESNTAVVLETQEFGSVLASPERAELWAQFKDWLCSNPCAAYRRPNNPAGRSHRRRGKSAAGKARS